MDRQTVEKLLEFRLHMNMQVQIDFELLRVEGAVLDVKTLTLTVSGANTDSAFVGTDINLEIDSVVINANMTLKLKRDYDQKPYKVSVKLVAMQFKS